MLHPAFWVFALAFAIVLIFSLLIGYCLSEVKRLSSNVVQITQQSTQHDERLSYLVG
jgi:hypothetical protein